MSTQYVVKSSQRHARDHHQHRAAGEQQREAEHDLDVRQRRGADGRAARTAPGAR